jgi:hypothetical protein
MTNCPTIQEAAQQSGSLRPKLRLEVQFKHALNQAADVVAENFAQRFVDLRRFGLASQRIPERTCAEMWAEIEIRETLTRSPG